MLECYNKTPVRWQDYDNVTQWR